MTEQIDYHRGAGLRVSHDGNVLVLKNVKDKRCPWTVVHLNDIYVGYYIGQTLTEEYVKDWWKLTYLMS
jgi:hypothetical protein